MASAPFLAACLAYVMRFVEVVPLSCTPITMRGRAALAGGQYGFGAIQPLLLGERIPAAGDLRPGEAVDLVPVAEFHFVLEAFQIQLVGRSDRRLADGKQSAQGFGAGGPGRAREREAKRSRAHRFAKMPACWSCDNLAAWFSLLCLDTRFMILSSASRSMG